MSVECQERGQSGVVYVERGKGGNRMTAVNFFKNLAVKGEKGRIVNR